MNRPVPTITVSYDGSEKRVALGVQPSLELSDSEVEKAESALHTLLRRLFSVESGCAFYLHEVETGRVMSKESFRQPSYCQTFPTHWFLVLDSFSASSSSSRTALPDNTTFQGHHGSAMAEEFSRLGEDMSSLDLEEAGLLSLAEISTVDTKYQSFTVKGAGDSGCALRYFSIQPITSLRSDTPGEHCDSRSHSRSDSYVSSTSVDSLDTLKLSTTFVGRVGFGSLAERAGIRGGFVVHMLNRDSILRSTVEQIKLLVDQCGDEVTLLGLPQDNDDLQFLYSPYTTGEAGQFSTSEGFITVVDLPLMLRSGPLPPLPASNGLSPPMGMMPFDAHSGGSQENSLSCDPYLSLSAGGRPPGTDDSLITCSLSEIGANWHGDDDPLPNSSPLGRLGTSPNSARHNGLGSSSAGKEWYEEEGGYSPGRGGDQSLSGSQDFDKKHRITQAKDKSLEALGSFPMETGGRDGKHHSDSSQENARNGITHSSHGCPSSEGSQQSGGNTRSHLEEQRMSGDSVGSGNQESSLLRSTSSSSSQAVKGSGAGQQQQGRRALRGYQSRRAVLHKSKSKIAEPAEVELAWGGKRGVEENDGARSPVVPVFEAPPPPPQGAYAPPLQSPYAPPLHGTGVEYPVKPSETPPPTKMKQQQRPLSAIEPRLVNTLLVPGPAPNKHSTLNFRSTPDSDGPLFTTVTAVTPAGEEEFREVNIGEAIARSQGNALSCQDLENSSSLADLARPPRKPFSRHKSIDTGSVLNASAGSSVMPAALLTNTNSRMEIVCHGLLSIKQDMSALGKKSQDRSWRNYYAVLAGTKIIFYRDKRDAVLEKHSDEVPLEVVPATVDLETKNSKRKFTFRLMTSVGQSYYLQASDAPNRQRWMELIQKQNAQHQSSWQSKMVRLSPQSMRRLSSPQPPLNLKPPGGGGVGGRGFLQRIKKKVIRQRDAGEVDFSSFVAFGQALKDCPVSPENKSVPLVVEFCVGEVEEHGLTVEGIYRKPGLVAMINSISVQMDKGNYLFDISDYGQDIHTIASLIKKYLKELPDPLIPDHMYHSFVGCARLTDVETRLTTLKDLVYHLPTAHYHTLRYLMKHLGKVVENSKENKMTLRNVALVFGPTLMRSTADGEELLLSMTSSYTIVELLCKHSEYLCAEDLCAEELEPAPAEQEDVPSVPPSSKAEKEQALASASPLSVRRIRNRLSTGSSSKDATAVKRHSSAIPESFGSIPKLANHGGSATLGFSESSRGHFHASDSNINTSMLQGGGAGGKKRPTRHIYDDVEIPAQRERGPGPAEDDATKLNPRTINWINHHTELNWGRGQEGGEEPTGSMWSSRNRVQRRNSKEKVRNGGDARRVSKTKSDQPPRGIYRQQTPTNSTVPQPLGAPQPSRGAEDMVHPMVSERGGQRGQGQGQSDTLRSRRISYMSAMNEPSEIPVKDTASHLRGREDPTSHLRGREDTTTSHLRGREDPTSHLRGREDTSTSHLRGREDTATSHLRGREDTTTHRGREEPFDYGMPYPTNSRQGNNSRGYGAQGHQLYSHPAMLHQKVHKYSSLQHDVVPPPSHHRRNSESSEPMETVSRKPAPMETVSRMPAPMETGSRMSAQYLQQITRLQEARPHRTFSNERAYPQPPHHSPPQREEDSPPKPHRTPQVESYL